jgi:surface protein
MYGEGHIFSNKQELRRAIETKNGMANTWDVSAVTDMSFLFRMTDFNEPIDKWDVSNVENMAGMFYDSIFNQDISKWDVSNVENMASMFYDSIFNQDISGWNVSSVENMSYMFNKSVYNHPLPWDVGSVENMSHMFDSSLFNHPLPWDVSNVGNMSGMFHNSAYNHPLPWDVENVENMSSMFDNSLFNHPLPWDVSNVENMSGMFYKSVFNQDISRWNVKKVTNMSHMFEYSKFNQDISRWNMRSIIYVENMFSESSMDEKNKPPLFSKEIKKKITIFIYLHGTDKSTKIVDGVPLHTSIAVRPGLCAFSPVKTTTQELDEIKEIKRVYDGKSIREGNKMFAEQFQMYGIGKVEKNISDRNGYTEEELRVLYNERKPPLRSIEYDRSYSIHDDDKAVTNGIYIINAQENGRNVEFTYPDILPSGEFTPTRLQYMKKDYIELQKTNLLNVAVAEHILPGGFPLSISDEYTNIPHYKRITLSDILLFFGKLGYDYVNIIDNGCRKGTVKQIVSRKQSIREHDLHTLFTGLYPGTGGKRKKTLRVKSKLK